MPFRVIVDNKIKAEGIFLVSRKLCFTFVSTYSLFLSFGRSEQVFLALRTLLEQLDM